MRCKNCGTEWSISIHGSSIQKFCPVCGKPVIETTTRQLATLEETLFVIRRDYGIGHLQDSTRIMAYFSDLAPHLRKEKIMLQHLIQCDGNTLLIAALQKTPSEQQLCLRQLASRLVDDLFLSESAAQMICSSFWNAITTSTDPQKEPIPEELFETSCNYEKDDVAKALQFLTQSAEAGYFPAQAKLAKWYRDGQLIKKNPQKAFYWYKKAVESGDPKTQCNLGWCYATGFGCAISYALAAEYFGKAAASGIPEGQYNLAQCYERGSGVNKDLPLAVSLYELAAKAGYTKAQYRLGRCYKNGVGLPVDIALAIYWYKNAAIGGSVNAQFELGESYEFGHGFDKDPDLAYYWYKKAAESGHKEAQERLSHL